jgi:hypothetical protein
MRKLVAAIVALACCLATAASAQTYSAAARQVLARAQAASGGQAWSSLRGLHETGHRDGRPYESWVDPIRFGLRVETKEAAGRHVRGFNGFADWRILPDGRILGVNDHAAMAQARTTAFLAAWAFYYPSRFAADGGHLGVRQAGGRSFDVLKVRPSGGEPRELWFDRRTHLLARVVDRTGARPVTTDLSDYRRVGSLLLPFRMSADRGGWTDLRVTEAVTLETPDRNLFSWAPGEGTAATSP